MQRPDVRAGISGHKRAKTPPGVSTPAALHVERSVPAAQAAGGTGGGGGGTAAKGGLAQLGGQALAHGVHGIQHLVEGDQLADACLLYTSIPSIFSSSHSVNVVLSVSLVCFITLQATDNKK